MKKTLRLSALLAFVGALCAVAATWTMDSSPFSFPSVGVAHTNNVQVSPSALQCTQYAKGKIVMHYQLQSKVSEATLSIYNVMGVCKATYKLKSASGSVEWNQQGAKKAAAGVYVAVLRSSIGEEKIKFSYLQ